MIDQSFSIKKVNFIETSHMVFDDEYITAYQSTNIVPKIYMSVNTTRDAHGFVSGKSKRWLRTRYTKWVTEQTFIKNYQKIREKL